MQLIYMGTSIYHRSSTALGVLYDEGGKRHDWGSVSQALDAGENVNIRPATPEERAPLEAALAKAWPGLSGAGR